MQNSESSFESEWLIKAISHNLRQKILKLINDNTILTYTDLMEKLSLSTGKLNFHLRHLAGLLEKEDRGNYKLTALGNKAIDILNQINTISDDTNQKNYLNSLGVNKSLKQIKPAPETKRKWYFWIIFTYGLFIWCPVVIIEVFLDSNFLNILSDSQKYIRIMVYIVIYTIIIFAFLILTCFIAKKYIETIHYEILDTEIIITKGLVIKVKIVIPFRTITNLVIRQGPIDFLLGISNIIIQTAGEAAKSEPEGKLIGVYYAKDFIEEILNLVRLLDPPSYLKERIQIATSSKNVSQLYLQILSELQSIDKKLTK